MNHLPRQSCVWWLCRCAWLCLAVAHARAQVAAPTDHANGPSTSPPATQTAAAELISLNFPDAVELKVLIDYVSQRLGINVIYDEQTVAQRVSLRTPTKIPKDSLLPLLDGVLRTKGLLLVDGDQPGWKRVVLTANLAAVARPTTRGVVGGAVLPGSIAAPVVAQVFSLQHADGQKVDQIIKPFLTQPGGSSLALADQRMLIVTDYSSNVQRIAEIVRWLDEPKPSVAVEFVPLRHVEVGLLTPQITQILTSKNKVQGPAAAEAGSGIELAQDARLNQLVIIGTRDRVDEALAVVKSLDVPLAVTTRVYQFKSISPERVDRLAKELIGPAEAKRTYQSVVDKEANLLVVTGSDEMHTKIEQLKTDLDIPVAAEQSPVRFYKLLNTTAADLLQTLRAMETDDGAGPAVLEFNSGPAVTPPATGSSSVPALSAPLYPGGNRQPALPGQPPPEPPIQQRDSGNTPGGAGHLTAPNSAAYGAAVAPQAPRQSVRTKHGTITADPNTNTLIVVADPSSQQTYEQLIRTLDKRRPQVLVECTIVTLDTTDDFSLGVELSVKASAGATQLLTFSSFGLSKPDLKTGQLAIEPGTGFNGTLIGGDVASAVIHALTGSGHARVLSAPKILVNDNATGTLASIAEAPFTSVNASTTVATTSFAGYASAGTTVTLTPHISEGDHLQLEYNVALNNFTGSGGAGVPPPRQTDTVSSRVTIPDGCTIVVGGLNRTSHSDTISRVPVLGELPLLQYLFSNRTHNDSRTTLFVFIRPTILRDDKFEDLKYFSQRDAQRAGLPDDFPSSAPVTME